MLASRICLPSFPMKTWRKAAVKRIPCDAAVLKEEFNGVAGEFREWSVKGAWPSGFGLLGTTSAATMACRL